MKLKPSNNRILVKPEEKKTKTTSGILLSETAEKPTTGEVLVGNKDYKKGDKVLFSKYGFDEVVIDEETLYVVSNDNVLGIFK